MSGFTPEKIESDRRLLELLSQNFGNISSAATEIINLEAILNLPKGTEHFIADIHGEADAFRHILKNASGNIKRKVNELFSTTMREDDIRQLCSLIYYPERKLALMRSSETHIENFYKITLHLLIKVLQEVSSKYSRSRVRKNLPILSRNFFMSRHLRRTSNYTTTVSSRQSYPPDKRRSAYAPYPT